VYVFPHIRVHVFLCVYVLHAECALCVRVCM